MAQTTIDNDALAARRLSDDFIQFRASHHLPDDLESSTRYFVSSFRMTCRFLFF